MDAPFIVWEVSRLASLGAGPSKDVGRDGSGVERAEDCGGRWEDCETVNPGCEAPPSGADGDAWAV